MKQSIRSLLPVVLLLVWAAPSRAQNDTTYCETESAATDSLTDQQVEDGWQLLFDGETYSGWHRYGGEPVGPAWKIRDGAMTLVPGEIINWKTAGGGDIVTDGVYEDFDLRLEWKISEGGNSGIFYLVDESEEHGDAAATGLEMQVLDSATHPDGKIPKHRAGDLYDLVEAPFRAECPVGAWNQVRIVKEGPHLEHWMNGRKLLEVDLWSNEWDELVAGSKFADWEGFGKSHSGHIGLQDHGDRVWYRNLIIRPL